MRKFKVGDRVVIRTTPRFMGKSLTIGYVVGDEGTITNVFGDGHIAVQFDKPAPAYTAISDDGHWSLDEDSLEVIAEVTDAEVQEAIASIRRAL